jgi:hypothetical protein
MQGWMAHEADSGSGKQPVCSTVPGIGTIAETT